LHQYKSFTFSQLYAKNIAILDDHIWSFFQPFYLYHTRVDSISRAIFKAGLKYDKEDQQGKAAFNERNR
jgi:hypothetical protein